MNNVTKAWLNMFKVIGVETLPTKKDKRIKVTISSAMYGDKLYAILCMDNGYIRFRNPGQLLDNPQQRLMRRVGMESALSRAGLLISRHWIDDMGSRKITSGLFRHAQMIERFKKETTEGKHRFDLGASA